MELVGENTGLIPEERIYQITIFGVRAPEDVRVLGTDQFHWSYREREKALYVELGGRSVRKFEVRLGLAGLEVMGQEQEQQIFAILQHAQIEYVLKDQIYDAVTHGRNTAEILAALTEMQVEPALYGAITEILTMDL